MIGLWFVPGFVTWIVIIRMARKVVRAGTVQPSPLKLVPDFVIFYVWMAFILIFWPLALWHRKTIASNIGERPDAFFPRTKRPR